LDGTAFITYTDVFIKRGYTNSHHKNFHLHVLIIVYTFDQTISSNK